MIKDVKVKQFHSPKVVVWSLIFREKDALMFREVSFCPRSISLEGRYEVDGAKTKRSQSEFPKLENFLKLCSTSNVYLYIMN